jgi:hypothetical protein
MARKNRTIAASAAISGHCALTTLLPQGWRILPYLPPWTPPPVPAAAPWPVPLPILLNRPVPGVPSASCFSVELAATPILPSCCWIDSGRGEGEVVWAHPVMSNRMINIQRSIRMCTTKLITDHVQCSNRRAPTHPKPEQQASASVRNGPTLYVTAAREADGRGEVGRAWDPRRVAYCRRL